MNMKIAFVDTTTFLITSLGVPGNFSSYPEGGISGNLVFRNFDTSLSDEEILKTFHWDNNTNTFDVHTEKPNEKYIWNVPTLSYILDSALPANYDNLIIKATKMEEIMSDRNSALAANIIYNTEIYQADLPSRTNLNDVLTALSNGATLPVNFTWRNADNIDISTTLTNLKELSEAIFLRNNTEFKLCWSRKDLVEALDITQSTIDYQNTLDLI